MLERNQPAQAAQILQLPWISDGVDDSERKAAEELITVALMNPVVFNLLMEMPWLVDGVTEHESWAILHLRRISREDPAVAETLLSFPWLADGVTKYERNAVYYLREILREDPAKAETLLASPWLVDGVSKNEEQILKGLRGLYALDTNISSILTTKPWFKDGLSDEELMLIGYFGSIANRNTDAAAALITMPFLESVEDRDMLALRSLNSIAGRNAGDFKKLMSHPRIKDGITDEETKIVAVLGGAYRYAPESAEVLLAESGVYIEERLIELPHTGETLLAVIRLEDKITPMMDHFEHAVRSIERFMGEPYPINYLALLYYGEHPAGASNNFTHLHVSAEFDTVDGPDSNASGIAHESAHWYWRTEGDGFQYQVWISEGSADFLRIISEHERIGRPLEYFKDPCPFFDNISELEKANPDRWLPSGERNPADLCYYSLGQRFFLDLYLALGDETFRPAYRTLYLRSQQDNPGDGCGSPHLNICRVEAALKDGASAEVVRKVDEVIARWYYGTATETVISGLENGERLEGGQSAERLKQLPWIADGVDDSERKAAEELITVAQLYPVVFNLLMEMPWLADGVTEHESWAVIHLRLISREDPTVAETLLSFPWLADGVTNDERNTVYYLREILRDDPAVAETLLGFPWLADGVTEDERDAVYSLRDILRDAPTVAETLLSFPWLADGVTNDERDAVYYLREILRKDPDKAKTLLGSPWLADGVTSNEEQILKGLRGLYALDPNISSILTTKPWFKDGLSDEELLLIGYFGSIANRNAEAAAALVAMPFLDSVEDRDMLALRSLEDIAGRDASDFSKLMSHPRIKDGITDEETKIIAVLGGRTYSAAPGSAEVLLAETGVYIQERLIELPHTGETLLAVIGIQGPVTRNMDYFEHVVRTIERFMGEPYPIDYLALLYYHNESNNANNNFTHLLFMDEYDSHPAVIAHETAHWYWRNDGDGYQYQKWISEGTADFLRIISEHERTGEPLEYVKDPCPFFDNISELEKADPDRTFIPGVYTPRVCYYSLGNRFFLDLYLALGDETFRQAFRTLYFRYRQDDPGDGCGGPPLNICRVEAAFKDGASAEVVRKVDEVVARWYGPRP